MSFRSHIKVEKKNSHFNFCKSLNKQQKPISKESTGGTKCRNSFFSLIQSDITEKMKMQKTIAETLIKIYVGK